MAFDNERRDYILYGITSYGIGCARKNTPNVYCHVPSVVAWINKTMNEAGGGEGEAKHSCRSWRT